MRGIRVVGPAADHRGCAGSPGQRVRGVEDGRRSAVRCLCFFSSRRRHTRCSRDWSSDVCSSDLKTATRTQIDEVRSGSSYISNNDMRVHFGLGKTEKIEYLEARWPSGLVERYLNPRADSILVVIEGSGHPVERTMQKLPRKDGD